MNYIKHSKKYKDRSETGYYTNDTNITTTEQLKAYISNQVFL